MRQRWLSAAVAAAALSLTACSGSGESAAPSSTTGSPATTSAASSATAAIPRVAVVRTLATMLDVPWGVTFLGDGSALVAERPTGSIDRVRPGIVGSIGVGRLSDVADQGEGGLLGLAFLPERLGASTGTVYAYLTSTMGDNRVVRMSFDGTELGQPVSVLTGIASAGNHNGGLLKIGPDNKLWIGTGDAASSERAQDRSSLNGKILRLNLDGSVPPDNPFGDSPVYSLGHRNVQGLAFDSKNQPWAIEFGQNRWDELNRIQPGKNYGWPKVEGKGGGAEFVDPVVQWATDEASPSGMAIVNDVAYIGGLRGERLWQVPLNPASGTAGTPRAWLQGRVGRIRNVVAAPGGGLWITTSNRDGRGNPSNNDDRVLLLSLGT